MPAEADYKIDLARNIDDAKLLILECPTSSKKGDIIDLKKLKTNIKKILFIFQHPQSHGLEESVSWNENSTEIFLGFPEGKKTLLILGE